MGRAVSIGEQGFAELREDNCFYVDKTDFIKEWWETKDKVTLITRPRRFGKTLNMNMLECFFSMKYRNHSDLFEGLHIWDHEEYRAMQGTWPVIFLSFAKIKGSDFRTVKKQICKELYNVYQEYRFLLESDKMSESDRMEFLSVNKNMDEADAADSLNSLSHWLFRHYGKKVIILLDEYDTPMQEAYLNGYWQEITSLLRNLFNATFKTNPYLARAVLTGITRVSKESMFSDLNNLRVVTTTSNLYATAFGFTEEEVFAALNEMGLSGEKADVKAWYDGFTFGTHKDIYNPWSITYFLAEKKYGAYWVNTSGNGLINRLIQEGTPEIKQIVEDLLKGRTLKCRIDEQIIFSQLDDNPEAIWSLFLASGYLKVVTPPRLGGSMLEEDYIYELALTNREVRIMFEDMIRLWFRRCGAPYNQFLTAMLKENREESLDEMNNYMNRIALKTFSFFDTGDKPSDEAEPERFYHGFVLGLLVELQDRYAVKSNRESGYGRYDVVLEPLNKENDPAFIFEFKVHNPAREKTLQETVVRALKQIEDKAYATDLEAMGIRPERIRKYGFAFQGKEVLIG